ncbi:type IV toxin-antitoxin system AbiEi family antitoxin domain-containing protein [Kitasatospora phosalacinea]|uniref:Type IV toxin-antitoxin system AbiEi family antitoxin domain-containing protein n=1 Tax=Kitasatospora phosalacinea TaxID=2065 RepID=A0ABW6GIW8_9ACTN
MIAVGGIAADQWGLVTAQQAAEQGISSVRLKRLTDVGLLDNIGRGVYLVTAAGLPQHAEIKVAWLRLAPAVPGWQRNPADPDSGVVSHASACLLHGLGDIPTDRVEISVPRRRTTRDLTVRLRTATIPPSDITVVDGLPVTTPLRTVVDLLRARTDAGHVGGVVADAERRDLIVLDELSARIAGFATDYGLARNAGGRELVDHLVAQARTRLRIDDIARAAAASYARGVRDALSAIREDLHPSLPQGASDKQLIEFFEQQHSAPGPPKKQT